MKIALTPRSAEERARLALEKKRKKQEKYYMSSQWQLMGRKLSHHKLAVLSFMLLGILYFCALFAPFLAPTGLEDYSANYSDAPPTAVHFYHEGEYVGPFVYRFNITRDLYENKIFAEDTSTPYPLQFFVKGKPYTLLGFIPGDIHLVGVDNSQLPAGKDPHSYFYLARISSDATCFLAF